jgi:hypothetical protein
MNMQRYVDEVMEIATALRYQAPLIAVSWQEGCCDCGTRFPGPCTDCAIKELSKRVGDDLAQRWYAACKEEQKAWKALEEKARTLAYLR